MKLNYGILHPGQNSESYKIGVVVKDNDGIKWQLIKPNQWIKYTYSYMHKLKPSNLKTNGKK